MSQLEAPVLIILYKRLETTERVFEVVRRVRPRKLFLAGNAPGSDSPAELEAVARARSIVSRVDWPCDLRTGFRTEHLGAKESITTGISWFLEQEPEGIILEDDCVVAPDFLWFAQDMLERYRNDKRVFQIGASNFQQGIRRGDGDYYFSHYNHIWGWATWARAWSAFDLSLRSVTGGQLMSAMRPIIPALMPRLFWLVMFHYVKSGKFDTWDFQWMVAMWMHGGLSVVPNENLVTNIGFGEAATNTVARSNPWANMPTGSLPGPWKHPGGLLRDQAADQATLNVFFGEGRPWIYNVLRLLAVSALSPAMKRRIKQKLARK